MRNNTPNKSIANAVELASLIEQQAKGQGILISYRQTANGGSISTGP